MAREAGYAEDRRDRTPWLGSTVASKAAFASATAPTSALGYGQISAPLIKPPSFVKIVEVPTVGRLPPACR